jgi:acetyl esterase/lipase
MTVEQYEDLIPAPTFSEVSYGPHERHVLDFWKADSDNSTPLALVIHGGGWNAGSKERLSRFVNPQTLLSSGISIASINYRLIPQTLGISPPVKAPMHDSARALQFIRSKAKEWNINTDRIGAAGGSAGACTSLWLAFHEDLADPHSKDLVLRESTKVYCAAVKGAQTSLDPQQMKKWTPNSQYGAHAFGKADFDEFLKSRDHILPWIHEYSPWHQAKKGAPSIYLYYDNPPNMGHEENDPTHSANFGVGLLERCRSLSIDCELAYPGAMKMTHMNITEFLVATLAV